MIRDVEIAGTQLSFVIDGIPISLANGLRRSIMRDVPTVAIRYAVDSPKNDDVHFISNTTQLHNEIIGHRLSMVPLHFTAKQTALFRRDDYKFVLKVSNTTRSAINITTEHIQILNSRDVVYPSSMHDALLPRDPFTKDHLLLAVARPGEDLYVEARASVGTGRLCSAFCPASSTYYNFVTDKDVADKALDDLLKNSANINEREKSAIINDFNALDRQRFAVKGEYGPVMKFFVETACGLSCTDILLKAAQVLADTMDAIGTIPDRIRPVEATDAVSSTSPGKTMHALLIEDADHTHGNFLQWRIFTFGMQSDVEYVGYVQPHPLEDHIILKLVPKDTSVDPVGLVQKYAKACAVQARELRDALAHNLYNQGPMDSS